MKTGIKNHWITGLSLLGASFLLLTGTAMIITGGEFNETGVRVFGVFAGLGGLSLLGGLWGLRTGRLKPWVTYALITVGVLVLGAGFWWFVFIPPIIALIVLYAGVIRQGLARELQLS